MRKHTKAWLVLAMLLCALWLLSGCGESAQTAAKKLKVGGIFEFGTFPNDDEPMAWIVLNVEDGKALLLSEYLIEERRFNETLVRGMRWPDSDLRATLNEDYAEEIFNEEERKHLALYQTDTETEDHVFLLNESEFYKYVQTKDCIGTMKGDDTAHNWWLRSASGIVYQMHVVGENGAVNNSGYITERRHYVRPAILYSEEEVPE